MKRRPRLSRSVRWLAALIGGCALLAAPVAGQFGRNRVQYRDFEWKIYHSTHFDVHYYESEEPLLEKTVSLAESAYDELSRFFDFQIQEPTPLIVYATHSAFLQNNIMINGVPEGVQAFATASRFRMVLPLDLPDADLLALIRHELTHIFQYHIIFRGRLGGGLRGGPPQWFNEGMASYLGQDESPSEKRFIRDAVVNDNIPSILEQGGGYFAYRYGHTVFDFIEERWGRETIVDLMYEVRNTLGGNIGRAIERVFRMDAEDFDAELRRWLRKKYLTELVQTGEPGDFGRPFRLGRNARGQELSPVASPSGDLVASITTDKGEGDISIFDANTRTRIKVLTKGLDKQISNLVIGNASEIGSDLAFSPDGNYIAAFGRREGFNSLIQVDVIKGGLAKIIDMEIEQARSPAWHPDNGSVVFTGSVNGQQDLFRLDLASNEITNITNDEAFDGAPAFSPDGKWLAYTSFLGEHAQILRLELDNPSKRYALTAGEHNNKEPVFSPDGKRIYFTSDRAGVDNIFGLDLEQGLISQYTNVVTACDKPTVLPLPEGGERLVYNGFWKRTYDLYMTDVDEPVAPPVVADFGSQAESVAAELPRFEPDIEVTIDDANKGEYGGFKFFLEDAVTFFGYDTNNIFTGRILLLFSDFLGDRRIIANVSSVDTFSDFDLAYLDLSRRWRWGVRLYDTRYFAIGVDRASGRVVAQESVYRITGAEASVEYPFSTKNRVELGLGYALRKWDRGVDFLSTAGNIVTAITPREDDYPIVRASFVSDSTIFGPWGAVSGHRVRIGGTYSPDLEDSGTLERTVFLDARQYFPVTRRSNFALRLWAVDSDGNFPNPVGIGGLDTVRGYDFREFAGHRAAFANVELRFPLIDQLAFPFLRFQGIRGVLFFDIGAAYFPDFEPDFELYDQSRLVGGIASFGYGVTIRFLGLSLNFDFAKLYDLENTSSSYRSAFWIGTRF